MIRMDTYAFQIAVVLNGSPVNLAGGTLEYTAKWAVTDPDAAAVIQLSTATSGIVVTDATNGLATITIPSSGTSSLPYRTSILYHDVRFTDSTGAVHTILYGTLTVKPNVSRT
jgi:hypothetical protein